MFFLEFGVDLQEDVAFCSGGNLVPPTLAHFGYSGGTLTFKRVEREKVSQRKVGFYDSCQGDSGGPLWTWQEDENGTWLAVLIGVTSVGRTVCGAGPALYTNLLTDYVQDWIHKEVGVGFRNKILSSASLDEGSTTVIAFTITLCQCFFKL